MVFANVLCVEDEADMAFELEVPRTAVRVGGMTVSLFTPDSAIVGGVAGATYHVQVVFSDGSMELRSGDLVPEIAPQTVGDLLAFMADMRVLATAGFIPSA